MADCDFCKGPREVGSREYRLASELVHHDEAGVPHVFAATWLACGPCAELIDARDPRALAQRSVTRVLVDPEVPDLSDAELASVLSQTIQIQSLFLEAWFEGPGAPG